MTLIRAIGDWFELSYDGEKWALFRVVAWGAPTTDDEFRLQTFSANGHGFPHGDSSYHIHLIYGEDLSPMGPTWNEIYRAAPQDPCFLYRDVTVAIGGTIKPLLQ